MNWNYRVFKKKENGYTKYSIKEVLYNDEGKILGWTEEDCYPSGDDLEELRMDFEYMSQAFSRHVLEDHERTIEADFKM